MTTGIPLGSLCTETSVGSKSVTIGLKPGSSSLGLMAAGCCCSLLDKASEGCRVFSACRTLCSIETVPTLRLYMAELTPEQLQEFETAFNQFDSDKDGRITINELGAMMRSIGQNPTDIELKEMIEEVDQDKDYEIDFNEFVTMMMKSIHDLDSEEKTMEAFRVFDRDGSGVIRVSELKSIMMQLGSTITEAEADDLLQLANQEEGLIDYVEFVKSIFGTSKAQEHEIAS